MPSTPCPNCQLLPGRCSCVPTWFWGEDQVQEAVRAQRPIDLVLLLRHKLNLRQADVARLTGLVQSIISRVEHGGGLSPDSAARLWKNLDPPEMLQHLDRQPVRQQFASQQSGVVPRPSGLRGPIMRAFEADNIQIDFAGFSSETLHALLQEPLDLVREQALQPQDLLVRILVPDLSRPQGLPARIDTDTDDPALRERARRIIEYSTQSLSDAVYELRHRGLLTSAEVHVRAYNGIPQFKMYGLNRDDLFVGYYPITPNSVMLSGDSVPINDLIGRDGPLFHHRANADPQSVDSLQVQQANLWFTSMWERYATEIP